MKRSLFVLFTLMALGGVARADQDVDEGARRDARGDHAGAVTAYQHAIAQNGYSADLLYDLGAAQLAADRLGPAIANLTRAHVLAPRDPEIDAALASARQRARVAPPARAFYEPVTGWLSPREWALAGAVACLLAAAALVAGGLLGGRRSRLVASGALVGLGLAVVGFGGSVLAARALGGAIVVQDGAVARRSPFAEAAPVFSLPAGEPVAIERQERGFAYVETRTGARGWVADATVTPLALADRPSG